MLWFLVCSCFLSVWLWIIYHTWSRKFFEFVIVSIFSILVENTLASLSWLSPGKVRSDALYILYMALKNFSWCSCMCTTISSSWRNRQNFPVDHARLKLIKNDRGRIINKLTSIYRHRDQCIYTYKEILYNHVVSAAEMLVNLYKVVVEADHALPSLLSLHCWHNFCSSKRIS